jgi:hypothetical protein
MKPIGCRAYVLDRGPRRAQKLESRALIGHLVGYDSTNIYRIWLPQRDEVIRTRDVVFDTRRFYEGPEDYASEAVVHEVVELLALPKPMVEDEIAIDELLTRRQRRKNTQESAENSTEASKEGDTHPVRQLLTPEASVVGD